MKVGDKWIKNGEIAEVVDVSLKNQRPEFRYKFSGYGYSTAKFHRLSDLEIYMRNHEYLPYNPEPEIKVGDKFTNNNEIITIGTSGVGYFVAIWPDGFSRAEIGPYSQLTNLVNRLKDLNFYKVVKEKNMETKVEINRYLNEGCLQLGSVYVDKYDRVMMVVEGDGKYVLVELKTGKQHYTGRCLADLPYIGSKEGIQRFKGEIKITQ